MAFLDHRRRLYRLRMTFDKTGWPYPERYPDKQTIAFVYREHRDAEVERLRGASYIAKLEAWTVEEPGLV